MARRALSVEEAVRGGTWQCVACTWQGWRGRRGTATAPGRRGWREPEGRRRFLEEVLEQCSERKGSRATWADVRNSDVLALGGGGLLARYSNSLLAAVQDAFPEAQLSAEDMRMRPQGYWRRPDSVRLLMDRIAAAQGVSGQAAWKEVTAEHVREMGGSGALAVHGGSIRRLLSVAYPDQEWGGLEGRKKRPLGHWNDRENRTAFLQAFRSSRGISCATDWRAVTAQDVKDAGGAGLLAKYGNSLARALADLLPEECGRLAEVRQKLPQGHWSKRENRRAVLDAIAEEMGVREVRDWRRVSSAELRRHGGAGMLHLFPSFAELLRDTYGAEDADAGAWSELCRVTLPRGHWEDQDNLRALLERVARDCGVREPEEWYRVSALQVHETEGGRSLLRSWRLPDALQFAYPELRLKEERFHRSKKAAQRHLCSSVRELFVG